MTPRQSRCIRTRLSISSKWSARRDDTFSGNETTFNLHIGLESEKVFGMTNSTSHFDPQRALSRRGQSGFGLLEALIGMVMVMLLIGAGATGLQTLRRTSSGANNAARLDALLVGTGEAIKRTEYKSCAEAADYDAAVKAFEDTRLPAERIQQTASGGQPSLQVDGVVLAPGCTDTSTRGDSGQQTVNFSASVGGSSRSASVVKLDPNKRLQLPRAVIDPPVPQSNPGDSPAVFSFTAIRSSGEEKPLSYEWDCTADGQPGTTTMMSTLDPNEQFICQYLADGPDPADPDPRIVHITLKVKDRLGQEDSSTIDFPIKDRDDPRLPPNAVATASASSGEVPFTVSFNSDQSSAPSGSIQSYEWDFGDGSEVSKLPNPTHVFQDTIPRTITLTVTDDAGLTGPAYLQFTGTVIGTLPPKAEFPAPTTFFKPAVVKFDGSSSVSYDGPLTYSWDFGDGKPVETSATPVISHNFTDSGSFTVTLTVKDIGGRTGFRTRTVEVKPLSPPKGFQATGGNPWLLLNTSWIDFAWINPTRAQGEELVVDIEIPAASCWSSLYARSGIPAPAGSQTYRFFQGGRNQHFCPFVPYTFRARTGKKKPDGTIEYGDYSAYGSWTLDG